MISTNLVLLALIAALLAAVILVLRSAGEIVGQVLAAAERCCGELAAAWKRAESGHGGCCCCCCGGGGGGGGSSDGPLHNPQLDKGMYEIRRTDAQEQDVLMGVVSATDTGPSTSEEHWVVKPTHALSLFTTETEMFRIHLVNEDPAPDAQTLRNDYLTDLPGTVDLHDMTMDWAPLPPSPGQLPQDTAGSRLWRVQVDPGTGVFQDEGYVHSLPVANPPAGKNSVIEHWHLLHSTPFPLEGMGRTYRFVPADPPSGPISVDELFNSSTYALGGPSTLYETTLVWPDA